MSRPVTPNRLCSRPVTPGNVCSRPVTPGSVSARRDVNVAAYNRGKEHAFSDAVDFCKQGLSDAGDEMIQDVRTELQKVAVSLRDDVAEVLDERQRKLESKLDSILLTVRQQQVSGQDNEKHPFASNGYQRADFDQGEANRKLVKRRDDQITQITEWLENIDKKVKNLDGISSLHDMMRQFAERLELLDHYIRTGLSGLRELHMESKSKRDEFAMSMQQVTQCLEQPISDIKNNIVGEIGVTQRMLGEHFCLTVKEIGHVQQALNVDYVMATAAEDAPVGNIVSLPNRIPAPLANTIADSSAALKLHMQDVTSRTDSSTNCDSEERILKFNKFKRVREFWAQTDKASEDNWTQTVVDPKAGKGKRGQISPMGGAKARAVFEQGAAFNDAEALKAKARQALIKPQYDVTHYYHTEGWCQRIVKSNWFDNATVTVVCLNAIWIAIDTDHNPAPVLIDAEPLYQIVENLFCTYFFFEICVRFMAFAKKKHAFMDRWFVFDFMLVLNMVIETWMVPGIMVAMNIRGAGNTIDVSMLRVLRLVKLLRLSRISRLLRSVPELTIIVKAIGYAARSVFIFFLLWMVIIYVFAVVLRQLTDGHPTGEQYFSTVAEAMNTLLIDGILADYAPLMHSIGTREPHLWIVALLFILLASITIMYMLVGVLVDCVGDVAGSEKENFTVAHVATALRFKMQTLGYDEDGMLTKSDFQQLILDPDVAQILSSVNVDVVALMDQLEVAYEDLEKRGTHMTFEKMVDIVLDGRGSNPACVKDAKEMLRILKQLIVTTNREITEKMHKEFDAVNQTLAHLQELQLENDDT